MMGNFVTLTNVNDEEFIRILRRKASPLYISVHATDGEVRKKMLRNPNAGNILERLTALKNHGLQFHAQIVLCPGYNDGDVLKHTIEDLSFLWPSALSVAIVPFGVTRFREHLAQIPLIDSAYALETVRLIESYQSRFMNQLGTRFVFLSDEFYCLCGLEMPEEIHYEDYPQIENGVGMIRKFEEECAAAYEELKASRELYRGSNHPVTHVIIPTGVSSGPHIRKICSLYGPDWMRIDVVPVINRFFGETITVTGLIVGQDLIDTLKGREFDEVLISESMLRENSECFLDDMTLEDVRRIIGKPVRIVPNNGESFIRALFHLEERQ